MRFTERILVLYFDYVSEALVSVSSAGPIFSFFSFLSFSSLLSLVTNSREILTDNNRTSIANTLRSSTTIDIDDLPRLISYLLYQYDSHTRGHTIVEDKP